MVPFQDRPPPSILTPTITRLEGKRKEKSAELEEHWSLSEKYDAARGTKTPVVVSDTRTQLKHLQDLLARRRRRAPEQVMHYRAAVLV